MSQQCSVDLLVDATVTGTTYRRLFNYDITNVINLRGLKLRVLEDLKAAGAPLETHTTEVVLRNYMLTDYDRTSFNSVVARSCALSDQDSWSAGPSKCCRLLSAAPSPQTPIGPADESRHAMLAVASRQFYDRSLGGGSVLPLEARIKPLAQPGLNASEGITTAAQPSNPNPDDASMPFGISSALIPGGVTSAESEAFDITVRDFRGRCHLVRVCGATSVSRLKTGIAAALGCSVVSHWRLIYGGRLLDDGLDLADYSISAGALVEVQMTSQQHQLQIRGKTGAISSLMSSDGSKDGVTCGSTAKVTGTAAAAHCGAPWGNPVAKGGAPSQMAVQVLLPSGLFVQVPRKAADDASQFLCRILEEEKLLLLKSAPESTAAANGTSLAPSPPETSQGLLPGGALPTRGASRATHRSLHCDASGADTRPRSGHLKGVVLGQKLLAVLLAAAAVVMAMVVL
ncbi:hypothetical protein VaNZ11_002004 [Volvox africanus]|uniref:Ubiquitin-like domain-containing protein n=1 Tax=Volvox africanus TaxID=51714 RepID=A0ABQ5RRA2_9CHLO|nr:hypothetical protein VaNZ11_002004 [Volvox africanus]